jgi:hypothetical protein
MDQPAREGPFDETTEVAMPETPAHDDIDEQAQAAERSVGEALPVTLEDEGAEDDGAEADEVDAEADEPSDEQ